MMKIIKALSVVLLTVVMVIAIGCKKENSATMADADDFDYVDLGLPSGTLWAKCNVGASNPEETGYYFAWGETETCKLPLFRTVTY